MARSDSWMSMTDEVSTLNPIRATARELQLPLPMIAGQHMRANHDHHSMKEPDE